MCLILLLALVTLTGFQLTHESVLQNKDDIDFSIALLNIDSYNERNPRDLSDVWNKIKSKIAIAWETLKKLTKDHKLRMKIYMEKIIEKIRTIRKVFENKLENLKEDFQKLFERVAAAEESLKNCLQNDKDEIETLLKEILVNVTTCITNNMSYLATLDKTHNSINDSLFQDLVQNKINDRLVTCEENTDKCLHNIKEEIIGDIDNATWNISYRALEVRNAVDNGLDLIIACVTEGLTKASTSIFNETVKIIQCVKANNR